MIFVFTEEIISGIILSVNAASLGVCIINGILLYMAAKHADVEKEIKAGKIILVSTTCSFLAMIASVLIY